MLRKIGWAETIVGRRRPDILALAVILLCTLVLFRDAIFRGWIYYEFDTTLYYYPIASWLDSALASGQLPLWSPQIYGGFPLFADGEGGVFYPPTVLFLALMSTGQAFVTMAVFHFFIAGAFTYAFIRILGVGRVAALVGALTYSFGSFLVTQMHHVNVIQSASWLPLILLLAEVALRSRSRQRIVWTIAAGGALSMQLLTLHVQPALMTLSLLGAYLLCRSVVKGEQSLVQRVLGAAGLAIGIVISGVALSAVQLLPMAELALHSARADSSTYAFGASFAPTVPNLITLLFPYFFRFSGYEYWTLWFRWEITIYVGIVPLVLALFAILLRRKFETVFFATVALLSVMLALGDYAPINVYSQVWHLPGMSVLRAPGRFSMLFVFSLAILAALGFEEVRARLDGTVSNRRRVKELVLSVALSGVALISAMVVVRFWMSSNRSAAIDLIAKSYTGLRNQQGFQLDSREVYDAVLRQLDWHNARNGLTFVWLFGLLAVLLAWYKWRDGKLVWQTVIVGLLAFDLLAFGSIYHPQISLNKLESPSNAQRFLIQHQGMHRVFNQQATGTTGPNRLLQFDVSSVGGYSSLEDRRYRDYSRLVKQGNTALLDLWNVRYLVSPAKAAPPAPAERYKAVFEDGESVVYENTNYLPRAFVVRDSQTVSSRTEALNLIQQPHFDPRKVVILEAPEGQPQRPQIAERQADTTSEGAERASVREYEAEQVVIDADVKVDSYLVVSDTYYPGWSATVDGQEAPIYRGDYLFRVVPLTPGVHKVVLRYEPMSFRVGLAIGVTAAVLLSAMAIFCLVSRRRVIVRSGVLELDEAAT